MLYIPEGGWESGRVIDYRPSYPSGAAQSKSIIFRFADISKRADAIINSGNLTEYGDEASTGFGLEDGAITEGVFHNEN